VNVVAGNNTAAKQPCTCGVSIDIGCSSVRFS
jgi:hypothetical protein